MEQEIKEPKHEITKIEFEIKINDSKLKIEINEDEIIFALIIELSCYKYIKIYKYKEIMEEFGILEFKNIKEVYEYFIKGEYKIINEEKKIIINNKQEIKLNETIIVDHELIKILVGEIKELKENNKKQNEKIITDNELIKTLVDEIKELKDNNNKKMKKKMNLLK